MSSRVAGDLSRSHWDVSRRRTVSLCAKAGVRRENTVVNVADLAQDCCIMLRRFVVLMGAGVLNVWRVTSHKAVQRFL